MTDAPFSFEIDRIKTHASRAEIISSLREYGRLHQCQTFGMREYDGWKKRLVTSDTIRRQFGSWTKALYEAGFRAVRGQCVKCGASPKKNSEVTLEVDHIIPVAEGGTNDPKNLQTLCWSCNQGKTDAPN